ncbi:DUF4884 domain-containing protein [Agrobacterium vaccinii]|uniref:DUF4884 domain-containing protein n=1 Tax=Agrobacterium vaccinii TaxID=2735528 RepID=UPI001E2B932A|nr:DUF4884 domain-containing protein [Agrobacterium vaccinii]UHS60569.1 DUF4884 domain-containing protein [Agrobacterium vaccinii]
MKSILALLLAAAVLASCGEDPVSRQSTDNPNVPVAVLFETDGCKVYRFKDAGRFVYFSNCTGTTTSFNPEACGKGCTKAVPISVTTEAKP